MFFSSVKTFLRHKDIFCISDENKEYFILVVLCFMSVEPFEHHCFTVVIFSACFSNCLENIFSCTNLIIFIQVETLQIGIKIASSE